MAERLDVILFGATGYTGQYCIKYVHKLLKGRNYTWGIAGRSEKKLKEILAEYQRTAEEDVSKVPIVVADAADYTSVKAMTARAKVIINCCGLYRYHGEPVVKACIETRTHQVDISIDQLYMEQIAVKYHNAARQNGVYIVSACGFNSICCDFGVIYTAQQFKGTLNSVEMYLQISFPNSPRSSLLSYATWDSMIDKLTLGYVMKYKKVHRELHQSPLPKLSPRLKNKSVHKSSLINSWNVPLEGEDPAVVLRTQRYLYEQKKQRPVQMQLYLEVKSIYYVLALIFFGIIMQLLVLFKYTRNLLLKYPKQFSMGFCTHEGIKKEFAELSTFSMTINGNGWKEKLSEPSDSFKTSPSENIACKISGRNPGFGITCTAATLAAVVMLEEPHKLPQNGGVYSPGAAFYDTSFLDKLQHHGLTFEVIKN